jgi:uncharacterized protein
VDRIAITGSARRLGLATALYEDFERRFASLAPLMACEVNLRPANDASMTFHLGRGFCRVGSQETEGGNKEVALLVRDLAPHERSSQQAAPRQLVRRERSPATRAPTI